MAAELVPVRLGITAGDLYTLWAPRWRDSGDEWEAFLGHDEALYAFTSAADLAAFVRSGAENDLTDHPAWETLRGANAHSVKPGEDHHFDLIAVEELAAGKPSEESVAQLAAALRAAGVRVDLAYGDRALKGAMRAADRSGARVALVAGDRDVEAGTVGVKDLSTGEQVDVAADAVLAEARAAAEATGAVEVRCEFCGQEYRFPEAELKTLFQPVALQHEAPPHLH